MELNNEEMSILVVEDNDFTASTLKRAIENVGYKVDIVLNGYDAVEKVNNNTYNYILMDIDLPGMNGIDTAKIIRMHITSTDNKVTRIIGISGHHNKKIIDSCDKAGMSGFIEKPILFSKLLKHFIKDED